MPKKLTGRFYFALILFSLVGQIAWVVENMYLNVFIYNMFRATAEDIAAMVAASAVTATLTTVFIGALSDRVGKRRLFISGGYILWGLSLFGFALIRTDILGALFPTVSGAALGVYLTILFDCLMTFFGSSANDAAFNAWLTDATDDGNRGRAEGINSMMPLVAILVVFGGFMFFDLTLPASWTLIFCIIGGVVTAAGVAGLFLVRDEGITPSEGGVFSNILYGFRPSTVGGNPRFYLLLLAFAVFNISIQIFMPYLIIYYEKTLALSNYVLVMAPAIIVASVSTVFFGRFYDKKGFFPSLSAALVLLVGGYLLLWLFDAVALVFIGSLLMMSGYLAGMAVFGAAIRDRTPAGKAGMLQGLRIFSQVLLPGVIGPAIGAAVLAGADVIQNSDGTTSFLPHAGIFLAAAAVLVLLAPALALLARKREEKPE